MPRPIIRTLLTVLLLLQLCQLCMAAQPHPPAPPILYLFDVSDLHLNHYQHCGEAGECTVDTPPPNGKTHADLLRDYDTLTLLTTLQGIVNQDQPRLYLDHTGAEGVDQFWLEVYQTPDRPYGWLAETELIHLNTLDDVLRQFAPLVRGLVIWDDAVPATLNAATTIAGVERLAVLRSDSPLVPQVTRHLPIKQSLVGMFFNGAETLPNSAQLSTGSAKNDVYRWAIENYLLTGRASPTELAYIEDGWPAVRYANQQMTRGGVYALERDYVVQQRGFAFDLAPWDDETPIDDPDQPLGTDLATFELLLQTASAQTQGDLLKIWGFVPWYEKYASTAIGGGDPRSKHSPIDGEWRSMWLISQYNGYKQGGGGDVFGVAMSNLSVHQFAPPPPPRSAPTPPTEADLIAKGYLTADGQVAPDKTFLLFYMGDYDIVHPTHTLLANYRNAPWLDDQRGVLPLAWGVNPGMVDEIPSIMNYLYATASPQDYFVGPNSGAGYINPDGPSELGLLRWLWHSYGYYDRYGYDVMGFLLNGEGAMISQRRLDGFTWLTPRGILSLQIQTDEPWPRMHNGVPLGVIADNAFGGTPESSAAMVHQVYQTQQAEGRPPFLAFRSAFLSPSFVAQVAANLQADDVNNRIVSANGEVIHPGYTVVDPYTFFALLERQLER